METTTTILIDGLIVFAIIAAVWTLHRLRQRWIDDETWNEIRRIVLYVEQLYSDQPAEYKRHAAEQKIAELFPKMDPAKIDLYIEAAVQAMNIVKEYPNLPDEAAKRAGAG